MKSAQEIARLRSKLVEHLESALAIADETSDSTVGFMVETALDTLRADLWPGNLDLSPRVKK